jgi:hypothetical protein
MSDRVEDGKVKDLNSWRWLYEHLIIITSTKVFQLDRRCSYVTASQAALSEGTMLAALSVLYLAG